MPGCWCCCCWCSACASSLLRIEAARGLGPRQRPDARPRDPRARQRDRVDPADADPAARRRARWREPDASCTYAASAFIAARIAHAVGMSRTSKGSRGRFCGNGRHLARASPSWRCGISSAPCRMQPAAFCSLAEQVQHRVQPAVIDRVGCRGAHDRLGVIGNADVGQAKHRQIVGAVADRDA